MLASSANATLESPNPLDPSRMLSLFTATFAVLLPLSPPRELPLLTPLVSQASSGEQSNASADQLQERLDLLVQRLEMERVAGHIPGMSLVVVKDDKVVRTQGFGFADVGTNRAVDAETIFAIGSSSKAFTSALAGMIQDDGDLDFDDPVTKYLPYFELPIEGPDEDGDSIVTLRDLMSHRTGFTRMTSLWAGSEVPQETILRTATKAEPWAGFREQFLYNNVMFLAAGMATAAAAEGQWSELMAQRIFEPLGMSSTSLSIAEVNADKRLALGYEWNVDTDTYDHKQMRDLVAIGPAGGINSNARDMGQWLRFQLGRGEFEGTRLLSEASLEETWSPNNRIAGEVFYGLGWMLREQRGKRIVEHGGNIDGFGAQVTLFPEENLGYALLTNVTSTPLQQKSISIALDILFAEETGEDSPAAGAAPELDAYLGNYEANFGSFHDDTFKVLIQNEHLAVDVPGQIVYELHSPDEEGKWVFRMTDQIAVSFVRDEEGAVIGLNMFQGGMKFEIPREGYIAPVEIPLAELQPFLGEYFIEDLQSNVQVVIQNGRLAVDIPSQMVFELRTPDEDGKRAFRISDEMAVRFNEDESGQIIGFTMFEGDHSRDVKRVGDAATKLPTPAALAALRKTPGPAGLLEKYGSIRTTGTIRLAQAGLTGTITQTERFDPPALRVTIDFGPFGVTEYGFSGDEVWAYEAAVGKSVLSGATAQQMARKITTVLHGDWNQKYDSVAILGVEPLDGEEVILVELSYGELPRQTVAVHAKTGQLLRVNETMIYGPMRMANTTRFADFREVDGFLIPYRATEENQAVGRTIQTTQDIELGPELEANFHVFVEPVK